MLPSERMESVGGLRQEEDCGHIKEWQKNLFRHLHKHLQTLCARLHPGRKTIFASDGRAFKLGMQRNESRGTTESKEKEGGTVATAPDPPGKLEFTCALVKWWFNPDGSILNSICGSICVGNRMGSDGKRRKVFKQVKFFTKHVNVNVLKPGYLLQLRNSKFKFIKLGERSVPCPLKKWEVHGKGIIKGERKDGTLVWVTSYHVNRDFNPGEKVLGINGDIHTWRTADSP